MPICETCGRNFKTEAILEAHKKQMNHYKVNIPCPACGRRFPDEKKLAEHMKTHKETGIGCPVCGKRFVDEKKLADHMKRMHADSKELSQERQESSEIKEGGSGVERPTSEEISRDPINAVDVQIPVRPVEKSVENNKLGERVNAEAGESGKAGAEKDIVGVKPPPNLPPPKLKPKKFLFPRIGKKNTFLITYLGKFYFEFILPDFPKEMQDELAETIADAVVEFIRKHKETTFTITKTD